VGEYAEEPATRAAAGPEVRRLGIHVMERMSSRAQADGTDADSLVAEVVAATRELHSAALVC